MNHFARRPAATLAGAVLALCAAGQAQAAFYELSWNFRWGWGSIVYDGGVVDSNPDPLKGSFLGAIYSYDVTGWREFTTATVTGNGGSIWVAATTPASEYGPWCVECGPSVLTFQFGAGTTPDPSAWQLTLTAPGNAYGGGDGLPPVFSSDSPDLWGRLELPSAGIDLGTINEVANLHNNEVASPVPEPETWLLMAIGLAGLAARGRFGKSSG